MIKREDMLELTRRMTTSRTSFTRIAGAYIDDEGFIDGTFNTNFLKLPLPERTKNLELAKVIPFSKTNVQLKEYEFSKDSRGAGSFYQLLWAMKSCGLKNDALMETFYELVAERYQSDGEYAIFVFHDRYDVPSKAADQERLWESEEVFEYLVCAICPLEGEYEPGKPECGFIFPAFKYRSEDRDRVNVFDVDEEHPHNEIMELLFGR